MNRRTQPTTLNGMMWGFIVIMQTMFLLIAGQNPNSVASVFMVLFGLTFFVGGVAGLIGHKIEQSELNMKEKMLGIELRLAEMAEKMEQKSG
jgi:hypothetical protein